MHAVPQYLGERTQGKEDPGQLLLSKVSQKVSLILDRIGRQCQLHRLPGVGVPQQAGIVPRGNAVKLLLMLAAGEVLEEGTKFDPAQGDRVIILTAFGAVPEIGHESDPQQAGGSCLAACRRQCGIGMLPLSAAATMEQG